MAWITKGPSGTYYVSDKDANGKNQRLGSYESKSLAEARVEELKSLKKRTPGGISYAKGKLAFRKYVEDWRDQFACFKKSYAPSEKFVIAAWLRDGSESQFLMDKTLDSISEIDIEDWMDARRDTGICEATLRRQFTALQSVFKACRIDWKMRWLINPTEFVKKPSGSGARSRRVDSLERIKLLKTAALSRMKYFPLVVEFALESAARQGEICGALVTNYNRAQKTLLLLDTKNGSDRNIPLTNRAIEIIEEALIHCQSDGLIFGTTRGAVRQRWNKYVTEEAGFVDLNFHDMRHERISQMFEEGLMSLEEIKSISGHKSNQSIERYLHLNASHVGKKMRGERIMVDVASNQEKEAA